MILYRKIKRGILISNTDPHFAPTIIEGEWKSEEKFNSELEEKNLLEKVENSPWFSYREQEKFIVVEKM